jgi:hypothetical protein
VDAVLKWVGIVGAAWMLLSILVAVAWAVGGRRIFRQPPQQPVVKVNGERTDLTVDDVIVELERRNRRNGGA